MTWEILDNLQITTDEENDIIYNVIYNHSNKESIDSEYDELLKVTDVFQHCI